jgi:hypothetical protein
MQFCRTGILLFVTVSSALHVWALPQQLTKEDLNTPAVRVSARLVLVDAVVTDKSRQQVKRLTKDDFTVLENGKPQNFSVFSLELAETAPPRSLELPPNVFTNRPEYDMPKGPLSILLLDGLNTAVAD